MRCKYVVTMEISVLMSSETYTIAGLQRNGSPNAARAALYTPKFSRKPRTCAACKLKSVTCSRVARHYNTCICTLQIRKRHVAKSERFCNSSLQQCSWEFVCSVWAEDAYEMYEYESIKKGVGSSAAALLL